MQFHLRGVRVPAGQGDLHLAARVAHHHVHHQLAQLHLVAGHARVAALHELLAERAHRLQLARLQQRNQVEELVQVVLHRRRRQQEQVALAQVVDELPADAGAVLQVVRLVHDDDVVGVLQNVPAVRGQLRRADGSDHAVELAPGFAAEGAELRVVVGNALDAELVRHLFLPLAYQRWRGEDQHLARQPAQQQLLQHQAGLDRLAQAHLVAEEGAPPHSAEHLPGGVYLERVFRHVADGLQAKERVEALDEGEVLRAQVQPEERGGIELAGVEAGNDALRALIEGDGRRLGEVGERRRRGVRGRLPVALRGLRFGRRGDLRLRGCLALEPRQQALGLGHVIAFPHREDGAQRLDYLQQRAQTLLAGRASLLSLEGTLGAARRGEERAGGLLHLGALLRDEPAGALPVGARLLQLLVTKGGEQILIAAQLADGLLGFCEVALDVGQPPIELGLHRLRTLARAGGSVRQGLNQALLGCRQQLLGASRRPRLPLCCGARRCCHPLFTGTSRADARAGTKEHTFLASGSIPL